jgi:hypothetical protein
MATHHPFKKNSCLSLGQIANHAYVWIDVSFEFVPTPTLGFYS